MSIGLSKRCLVPAVITWSALNLCSGSQSGTDVDVWVYQNLDAVRDTVLPGGNVAIERVPDGLNWRVIVRVIPYDDPEYRLEMESYADGTVRANLTAVQEASVSKQMETLKKRAPRITAEGIAEVVRAERINTDSKKCLAVVRLASQYEKLSHPMVVKPGVILHGTEYEVWYEVPLWFKAYTRLIVTEDRSFPLTDWTATARESLLRECQ